MELLDESRETLTHLKEENWNEPDLNDRASIETETTIELRTRDRYRKLIDKIERFGNDSQADLLGEISLLGPESKHKMILSQQLVDFQDHWKKFKTAAMDGIQGKPLDPEQLETLGNVRAIIDQTTYEMIRDRTPVVRSADGPAWLRTWERIQVGEPDTEMEDPDSLISHIQLLSQPESYRGRWVEISGTIRGASLTGPCGRKGR